MIEIEVRIFSFSLVLPFFLSSHAGTCDAEATRRRLVRAFLSPEEPLNGTKSERTNEPREIGVIALVQVKSRLETTNPPPSLAPPLVPFLSFFPPFFSFYFTLYLFTLYLFVSFVFVKRIHERVSYFFLSIFFPLSLVILIVYSKFHLESTREPTSYRFIRRETSVARISGNRSIGETNSR